MKLHMRHLKKHLKMPFLIQVQVIYLLCASERTEEIFIFTSHYSSRCC